MELAERLEAALKRRNVNREVVADAFHETERQLLDVLGDIKDDGSDEVAVRDKELLRQLRVIRHLRKSLTYTAKQDQVEVMGMLQKKRTRKDEERAAAFHSGLV